MGADLICYIAFGPRRIDFDEQKKAEIARKVRKYLDACIAATEQATLDRESVPGPRNAPMEAKRSVTLHLELQERSELPKFDSVEQLRAHPDYRSMIENVLIDCDYCVEAACAFEVTLEDLAKEIQAFVDGWNHCGLR